MNKIPCWNAMDFRFSILFLYAKQGWRFDDKAHLLGFGFDYHI